MRFFVSVWCPDLTRFRNAPDPRPGRSFVNFASAKLRFPVRAAYHRLIATRRSPDAMATSGELWYLLPEESEMADACRIRC